MSPVNVILSHMITLDYSDCSLILKHDFTVWVELIWSSLYRTATDDYFLL